MKTVRQVVDDIHARLRDRPGHKECEGATGTGRAHGLREVARASDTAAVGPCDHPGAFRAGRRIPGD